MKGTDLTQAQIDAAERFILARRATGNLQHPAHDEEVRQKWGDLVRIVAWYGALRYKAGKDGINSLENPGDTEVLAPREAV
jgi:hypothetical protein